jgi:hypothetical protein
MNESAVPGSAFLREKVEGGLTSHPGSDPEGLRSRIGFFYYPLEKVIDINNGWSGNGADFCRRVTEIIQGCHIEGTAPDHTPFCNHTDQVNGSERDNKSRSIRIFKVNNLFCHGCIMILCSSPANNGTGTHHGIRAEFMTGAAAMNRGFWEIINGERGLLT